MAERLKALSRSGSFFAFYFFAPILNYFSLKMDFRKDKKWISHVKCANFCAFYEFHTKLKVPKFQNFP